MWQLPAAGTLCLGIAMHTVRNRVAARPRLSGKGVVPPAPRRKREPAFMLLSGNPPAFPTGLIVPPPRGAVIATVAWPDSPVSPSPKPPRAKAKPARKRASPQKRKKTAAKAAGAIKPPAKPRAALRRTATPAVPIPATPNKDTAMTIDDLIDRALAVQATLAEAPVPVVPLPSVPAALPLLAADAAIPRARALAPQRGTGLVDAIAVWLHDAARWLARWGGRGRRKADARAAIARARARQHALQSGIEALEALRELRRGD